jgi:ABC-2 type transport system ATP-binding protein
MAAAIETDNLTKDFLVGFWRRRPYRALDGLSLAVEPGEVFGFLGPNGAGKSTTLKLLMQLIYPTAGSAHILGKPIGDVAVRKRIGFLAENPYYYDYLTAEEVLAYFARLHGLTGASVKDRVGRVLDQVGIGAERRLRLRQISKGMLQRVGLAQAIVNEPDVVFLDEPMSGLDPLGRRDVRELILDLRARGCTVFFSSHILSDAESLCSRVAILAQGRLVANGRVSEMVAFAPKGWELVVAGVSDAVQAQLAPRVQAMRALSAGRFTIHVGADQQPEPLMAEIKRLGARVESLNPLRDTLEDYFVQQVQSVAPRETVGL